jgi:hypothetical protein
VDLKAFLRGRAAAEELQETVATKEELAQLHPAHAAYVYAQHHVAVLSEQLTALEELAPFVKLISKAEDLYMPDGPPISPLTRSYFTCWALFDACVGPRRDSIGDSMGETIGTIILDFGAAVGMHPELLRVVALMQESRMGLYVHEGQEGGLVLLRELATDALCRAIVPAGYSGRTGELWYARLLPPPLAGGSEYVVFTTPYILLKPGRREWLEYFQRTLPDAPREVRLDAYHRHMKYGPTLAYWSEFVFEGYVNHRTSCIYLAGLPDVPESRPHSDSYRGTL